jgi:hypothetical protein
MVHDALYYLDDNKLGTKLDMEGKAFSIEHKLDIIAEALRRILKRLPEED